MKLTPPTRLLAPLALVAVALCTAGTALAAEKLAKKPYENRTYGFYLFRPEGWVSVPPQPGEKTVMMKFQSDAASKGWGFIKSELEVLYIPRKTVETEQMHKGATKATKYERNETAFVDYVKRHYMNGKAKQSKFMRVPKKLKGALQFKTSCGTGSTQVEGIALVIPFADKSADIALHYFCTAKEMKKLQRKVFIPSLGSFRWSQKLKDRGAKDDEKLLAKAGDLNSPVGKRALEVAREIKDMPGWAVEVSDHYVFVFNARRKIVDAVKTQIERILPSYLRLFPPADPDIFKKIAPIVRITKDLDIYHAYGGPGGSAGYWSSGHEELVFYDDGGKGTKTLAVLRHEAFHQYIYYSCGAVAPHSWFNEGYGDYFAGCQVTPKGALIEKPFSWRMSTIANAVRTDQHVPLREITSFSQSDYYGGKANIGLCYAEGWSIIYFLNKGPKSSVKRRFKPEWKDILHNYFETLKKEWGDPSVGEDSDEPPPAAPGAPPGTPDDDDGDGDDAGKPGEPAGPGGEKPPAKPGDTKPDAPKPGDTKPDAPKPGDGKPDAKPDGPKPGDAKPRPKPKRKRPRLPGGGYMARFQNARKKAVAAAFPDWTDEQWDEFENVWKDFVKKNFK